MTTSSPLLLLHNPCHLKTQGKRISPEQNVAETYEGHKIHVITHDKLAHKLPHLEAISFSKHRKLALCSSNLFCFYWLEHGSPKRRKRREEGGGRAAGRGLFAAGDVSWTDFRDPCLVCQDQWGNMAARRKVKAHLKTKICLTSTLFT